MKIRNILAIVLFVCFISLAIGQVSASDDVSVSCDAKNFTGLNDSIQKNTAIELNYNITLSDEEKDNFVNGIEINKSITIDGKNHVIDANNAARIFNITNDTAVLTLKDITLKNGNTTSKGSAIYSTGNMTLNCLGNVLFENNSDDAIYSTGNMTLKGTANIYFLNNIDTAILSLGSINITASNVEFCGSDGTAIHAEGNVILNVTNNVLFKNNEGGSTAGIHTNRNLTITAGNVEFSNNFCFGESYGGAIRAANIVLNVIESVLFCNNSASYGGAINGYNITINADSVEFSDNKANVYLGSHYFGYGGAICASGNLILNVTDSILFVNNIAGEFGGAIYAYDVNITDAIFYGNKATNGSAIVLYNYKNNTFNNNYWGLNYKNKDSIIKEGLISIMNVTSGEIEKNIAPDNWVLLNITAPEEIVCNFENIFHLEFGSYTNGTWIRPYDKLNGSIIVKTIYANGTATLNPVVPGDFIVTPNVAGKSSLSIFNLYTGEEISNVTFNILKMNSTLNVVTNNITYGQDAIIVISLVGDDGKAISDIVNLTINDVSYNVNVVNGFAKKTISDLTPNEYTVIVKYNGDLTHNNITNTTKFNVFKASSKEISVLKINSSNVVYGEEVYCYYTLTYENGTSIMANITFELYNENNVLIGKVIKNTTESYVRVVNESAGFYTLKAIYKGNNQIQACSNSTSFKIAKANTTISFKVENITVGEIGYFIVNLSSKINTTVVVYVGGEKYLINLTNGSFDGHITNFTAGNYIINIIFPGNENYTASANSTNWTVKQIETKINASINNITYGGTGELIINLDQEINVPVTIFINSVLIKTINLTNGQAKVNLTGYNAGNYVINARFDGNDNYTFSRTAINWTVKKINTNLNIDIDEITYGETGKLIIDLDQGISVPVTLIVCGHVIKTIDLVNGHAETDLTGFDAGDHIITVIFEGTQNYALAKDSANWTVGKAVTTFVIDSEDIIYGQDEIITVNVRNNLSGIVTLKGLGDNEVIVYVYTGVGSITLSDLKPGNYSILGLFIPINSNYDVQVNDTSFTVTDKEKTSVIVDIDDVYYIEDIINETVSVLPSDATGKIEIYYNDTYITHLDLVNGSVTYINKVPNIPGYWKIDVVYTGDDKYYGSYVSKNVLVMSKDNFLIVDDLEKYYTQDYPLIAKLLDCTGTPLSGEIITFTINGKTYTRTTNSNGIAIMNINLQPGDYTVEVASGNLTKTVTVTVLNTIYGEDVVKMYKNDTQYYAYFTDSNGLALANTNVTFNINGVFYTRTTNASGVAKLNINLQPGKYIITAYNPATGDAFSNNITVNPPIVGSDLTKKYSETGVYTVLAYDNQGKPLTNATININIHGVFYYKTTDDNGVARLNINLAPGEYIATAYYNGYATSNKITVLEA